MINRITHIHDPIIEPSPVLVLLELQYLVDMEAIDYEEWMENRRYDEVLEALARKIKRDRKDFQL